MTTAIQNLITEGRAERYDSSDFDANFLNDLQSNLRCFRGYSDPCGMI